MFEGLNRLLSAILVAGAVTAAVLVGPAAAASCGSGSTSAVSVYRECQQNGGGGKTSTPGTHSGTHSSSTVTVHHYSTHTTKALNKAGKDEKALAALVNTTGARQLYASKAPGSTPSAVGSAFDLTSGPTALLIVLAGTALLLVAGSGMRVWHGRRRV